MLYIEEIMRTMYRMKKLNITLRAMPLWKLDWKTNMLFIRGLLFIVSTQCNRQWHRYTPMKALHLLIQQKQ